MVMGMTRDAMVAWFRASWAAVVARGRQGRRIVMIVCLAVGFAVGPASVVVAAPGDTATVRTGYMYLDPDPVDNMHTVCKSRYLYLAGAKRYNWSVGLSDQRFGSVQGTTGRYIDLGSSDYVWEICIDPKDGYYILYSELDPVYPPWRTVRLTSRGFTLTNMASLFSAFSRLDPPF